MDRHCRECADEINAGDFDLVFANSCTFFNVTPIGRYVSAPRVIYLGEPCRWLYEAMPRLRWAALSLAGWSRWKPSQVREHVSDALRVQAMRIQVREELNSAQAFDAILVNSLYSRESVLRAYGLDSKVCYLGIDTCVFKNERIPRQDFVVGIGEIKWPKNIHFVIEALGAMTGPRPRLIWIGNEVSPSYLEDLKQLAVTRKVTFEPRVRVSDEELVDILNRALAMVYAPRLEPFGLAPLEANACGLPVIAVAEGGVRETIQHGVNGLLVEHEPRSMAAAVERLRDQPGYSRELGERACQQVHDLWSLPASIDRLEQRFAEVLEARRR
jgi:glycosyltransferase involved in cell wall biosynthesis